MDKSQEIQRKITQAKLLATLEVNPAWQLIASNLEAQIEANKASICQPGMDFEKTERLRNAIVIMQWCRNSTLLATPEQFEAWERELAFQEKREKMRKELGPPAQE